MSFFWVGGSGLPNLLAPHFQLDWCGSGVRNSIDFISQGIQFRKIIAPTTWLARLGFSPWGQRVSDHNCFFITFWLQKHAHISLFWLLLDMTWSRVPWVRLKSKKFHTLLRSSALIGGYGLPVGKPWINHTKSRGNRLLDEQRFVIFTSGRHKILSA